MNANAPHLDKRSSDPAGLDFEGLRQAGIDRLQQMCGEIWTDYNLHDPGITILEQLCYGLTDLVHRSGLAVEEYLFGPDGRIDAPRHALLPPEQALPCHPVTPDDYRKLLADAIPAIRNIWVSPAAGERIPGIVNIRVQLAGTPEENAAVREAIALTYLRHRNLGEDLGGVEEVHYAGYRIDGDIEIDGRRAPAEILADIYLACTDLVSPRILQQPYERLAAEALDRVLDGPFTPYGCIGGDAFRTGDTVTLAQLVQAAAQVSGVRRIDAMRLLDESGRPCHAVGADTARGSMPRLLLPQSQEDISVRFRIGDHERHAAIDDFLACFRKMEFAADSRQHAVKTDAPLAPLPQAHPLALADYTSVQAHFPRLYGISDFGLPASAPPARQAQARQLKAYLLLFDQIMANFAQDLERLRDLYSLDESLARSYFHQSLAGRPEGAQFYQDAPERIDAALGDALAAVDDFGDRRRRVLDFLLALHGEKFSQHSLHYFGTLLGRPEDPIRSKIAFLRQAPTLNADRMSGCNYALRPSRENRPALAQKLALLLGLDVAGPHPMTAALRAKGFRHLSDDEFRRRNSDAFVAALPEGHEAALALDVDDSHDDQTGDGGFLAQRLLFPSLINGVWQFDRYRIVAGASQARLYFELDGKRGYAHLSDHGSRGEAMLEANRLARRLGRIVEEDLAFHLVEHLLLRPAEDASGSEFDADFYACRVTAVFPAWSYRLANPEFRKLAEETLFLCTPAHLRIDALWLAFEEMTEFERLYWTWRRQLAATPLARAAAAEHGRALGAFLQTRLGRGVDLPARV